MRQLEIAMKVRVVVVLAAALPFVLACSGLVEEATERATEAVVERATGAQIDLDEGGVNYRGPDGSVASFGANVTVPAEFPSDIPVYPNATVTMAEVAAGNGGYLLGLQVADSPQQVMDFYRNALKSGFDAPSEMSVAGLDALVFTSPDQRRTVVLSAQPSSTSGGTDVQLVVSGGA
jgi:hypothetical protein